MYNHMEHTAINTGMEHEIILDTNRLLEQVYALAALQGALGTGPRREEILGPDRSEAIGRVMDGALTMLVMAVARHIADYDSDCEAGILSVTLRSVPAADGSARMARRLMERFIVMKTLEWAYAEIDPELAGRWCSESAQAAEALDRLLDTSTWHDALITAHPW